MLQKNVSVSIQVPSNIRSLFIPVPVSLVSLLIAHELTSSLSSRFIHTDRQTYLRMVELSTLALLTSLLNSRQVSEISP